MHHKNLIDEAYDQFREVFENSKQGIYIYLDDTQKVCNMKFAKMLGYDSDEEWKKVSDPFAQVFVSQGSQETLVLAYQSAMEECRGSVNKINWKTRNGKEVHTEVILVPIVFQGHLMAFHFITKL